MEKEKFTRVRDGMANKISKTRKQNWGDGETLVFTSEKRIENQEYLTIDRGSTEIQKKENLRGSVRFNLRGGPGRETGFLECRFPAVAPLLRMIGRSLLSYGGGPKEG